MNSGLILVTTAIIFIMLSAVLGYLAQKIMGAVILFSGSFAAAIFCLGGAWLGYYLLENQVGVWVGLLLGMVLAGIFVPWSLGKIIRGNSRKFIINHWIGFCALSIYGYLAASWVGLLTITWPMVIIYWVGLYLISYYILPLKNNDQRPKAFRALITSKMGTNYPCYFSNENNQLDLRISGNPFFDIFAGPGLLCTRPYQAAYISDGVITNRVAEPGLTFTHQFEEEVEIVDLRPQLRAFDVEAQTSDGITINVPTFIPFRIDSRNQAIELGQPFPVQSQAVHNVLVHELIERKDNHQEAGEKYEWDGKFVQVAVSPIIRDIISHYTVDELCENSRYDPRSKIADEMRDKVQEALHPYGLEVLGGGIGNLAPQDDDVMKRRIKNWKIKWEGQMNSRMSEGEAHRLRLIEEARANVEGKAVEAIAKTAANGALPDHRLRPAIVLRYIDSLREIINMSNKVDH